MRDMITRLIEVLCAPAAGGQEGIEALLAPETEPGCAEAAALEERTAAGLSRAIHQWTASHQGGALAPLFAA